MPSSLFRQLGSVVQNAIMLEKSERLNADAFLQNSLQTETTARQTAITSVINTLSAETTNRQNADATLTANLSTEISARQTAITTLTNAINDQLSAAAATGALPFDIAQFINGKPLTGEVLVKVIAPRPITIPQNLAGSYMKSGIAATANTVLTVYKNGASQGTVTFAAGATTGNISTSAFTLNAGDILSVAAPSTVDSSFADFVCVITGSM